MPHTQESMPPKKHCHHHHPQFSGQKLFWVSMLNLTITAVQIIGGIISNSLSLVSDAIHNLGDSSAIFIAFLAGKHSKKQADEHCTFGYKRIEILAALLNASVLIGICLFLFFEAYQRFLNPEPIKGQVMFIVAIFGLMANLISVLVLNKDKDHNLNTKAAYLHLMGDTLSSVAVIVGGLAIWLYNIYWIDPLITTLVGIYIIYHTWGIIKQTFDILMQSTPEDLHLKTIKTEVERINGIADIHHMHAWKLDDNQTHLEAHINVEANMNMVEMMHIKKLATQLLHEKFFVKHITLQMEYNACINHKQLIHA